MEWIDIKDKLPFKGSHNKTRRVLLCVTCKDVGLKIRLIKAIPVEAKHGLKKGQELTTVWPPEEWGVDRSVWVQGGAGEPVRLRWEEWELLATKTQGGPDGP